MGRISRPFLKIGILSAVILLLFFAYYFSVPCPVRHFLGIICPGCGMTHAVLALLRLDLWGALMHNPLFLLFPPLILYFLFDGRVFGERADRIILISMPIAVLAVYIPRLAAFLTT